MLEDHLRRELPREAEPALIAPQLLPGMPHQARQAARRRALVMGLGTTLAVVALSVGVGIAMQPDPTGTAPATSPLPEPAARSFDLTTHKPGNSVPGAQLNTGTIVATAEGCPYLDAGAAGMYALVWPPGWTASEAGDGFWVYSNGSTSLREGDQPSLAGGGQLGTTDPCGVVEGGSVFRVYSVSLP